MKVDNKTYKYLDILPNDKFVQDYIDAGYIETLNLFDKNDTIGINENVSTLKNENAYCVQYTCIWNIIKYAKMNLPYRDLIIELGAIDLLIKFIQLGHSSNPNLLEYATNCIAVLCYRNPMYENILPVLQPMMDIIRSNCSYNTNPNVITYNNTISNALWAVTYIFKSYCDHDENGINNLTIDLKLIPEILNWCEYNSDIRIIIPLVRSLGHIACGDNEDNTSTIISYGGLRIFNMLLNTENINVQTQICWTVSNILCDHQGQLLLFMKETEFVDKIINLISSKNNIHLQVEALYVLKNIVTSTNYTIPRYIYIDRVIDYGAIKNILDIINDNNKYTIYLAFDIFICLLSNITMNHEYIPIIKKLNGLECITKCLTSPNNVIALQARTVLERIGSNSC